MKDLARKFTRIEDLMMVLYTGTCPMAKACMLFDQTRKSVGCSVNSEVLSTAEPDLLLTIASQVLTPSSDTAEGEKMRALARVLRKKVAMVLARKRATAWELPPGLDPTQVLPRHILHFLCMLYENYELYNRCRHILLGV